MALKHPKATPGPLADLSPTHIFAQVRDRIPRHKLPEHELPPDVAYQIIHDELMLDGNSRQNLATFCQTWLEPEIHDLMNLTIDKNMIDKDEYPQTAELEARCVHMLADLWNSPDAANTLGTSTTGSTMANRPRAGSIRNSRT